MSDRIVITTAGRKRVITKMGPRGADGASSGVTDGDKGDVEVTGSGTVWTIGAGVVTAAKVAADVATQAELDLKAPLASPTFTGTVTLPVGLTGVVRTDTGVVSVDSDVTDLVSAASDIAAGKVELATTAETTTGTDTTRAVTPDGLHDMTSLTGAAWFLDEDTMTSDSATQVPSQQSVKAYVDAVDAGDIGVTDTGTFFTGTDVEAVLQEVGTDLADAVSVGAIDPASAPDTDDTTLILEDGVLRQATPANLRTIINVEAGADVTDATNVNAAGAVMESDYNANTALVATADNTPAPLTFGASTIFARLATGDIIAATPTQLRTLLNVADGATDDLSAAEILALLLTVDGPGSTLDADTLDGISSTGFAIKAFGTTSQTFSNTAGRRIVIENDNAVGTNDILMRFYYDADDTAAFFEAGSFFGAVGVFQLGPGGSTAPDWSIGRIGTAEAVIGGILDVQISAVSTATLNARVGGRINSNITPVGNVGTGEDTLQTFSVPAASLATNGQSIRADFSGSIANNANAKRIRLKFGSTTLLDTGALTVSRATDWWGTVEVFRTGAATQTCRARIETSDPLLPTYVGTVTAAETLSGALSVFATGEAVSNNDVTSELLTVDWIPNR